MAAFRGSSYSVRIGRAKDRRRGEVGGVMGDDEVWTGYETLLDLKVGVGVGVGVGGEGSERE